MARASVKDPLDRFRWIVQIDEFSGKMGFSSIGVPSHTITTHEYPEGGAHLHPRQIVDTIFYTPVTLNKGVTGDIDFYNWAKGPFDVTTVSEKYLEANNAQAAFAALVEPQKSLNSNDSYRRTVKISHLNRNGQEVKSYTLYNAIPVGFIPASEFDATNDNEVSIESLTLQYEGFTVETQVVDLNPFSGKSIIKRIIRNF